MKTRTMDIPNLYTPDPQTAEARATDAPGIVVTDGGLGTRTDRQHPRVVAFVYGEELPASPTLPFGRWKQAS